MLGSRLERLGLRSLALLIQQATPHLRIAGEVPRVDGGVAHVAEAGDVLITGEYDAFGRYRLRDCLLGRQR